MKISKSMIAAGSACAMAAGIVMISAPAHADQFTSCNGGTLKFNTSPIGPASAPVNGTLNATFTGCSGDTGGAGTAAGTFNGQAACGGAGVLVDADLNWANGKRTHVSGPWHMQNLTFSNSETNTLPVTGGDGSGTLAVTVGQISNVGQTVPDCLAGQARSFEMPITNLVVG
ncbi:hypothetical protein [Nocardia arthritidis]|uniref:Secreted protein n=1 Tax=Nocardia arthritidis TaxID=228602 RepID=A0A6G9YL85_9NOCA|nr:hypothetical protein [Nocardia arthritidis]QIS13964.1 hypothetical protein F5544_30605 [Nocardia arthritidis]